MIDTDTTITVDTGNCADLVAAIRGLDATAIAGEATVTIEVSGGPYACAEPLVFVHRDGPRIALIGNPGGGPSTAISFDNVGGVVVGQHRALGRLDGFVLNGIGAGSQGVHVQPGASATVGPDVTVVGFSGSCYVTDRGAVLIATGTVATQCGGHGYQAKGGLISADDAQAVDNAFDGFAAALGGRIEAARAAAADNGSNGFRATQGAVIIAQSSSASNNGIGYNAQNHSYIDARDGSATNNASVQLRAGVLSYIQASNLTGVPAGDYNIPAHELSDGGGYIAD
ncbi:hypothetical protein [Haliangium sp.]|uniref:hypothetical protein n=1 Tax=Haliangium sp. TaxID=2663208 RepID=UPI003D0BED4B